MTRCGLLAVGRAHLVRALPGLARGVVLTRLEQRVAEPEPRRTEVGRLPDHTAEGVHERFAASTLELNQRAVVTPSPLARIELGRPRVAPVRLVEKHVGVICDAQRSDNLSRPRLTPGIRVFPGEMCRHRFRLPADRGRRRQTRRRRGLLPLREPESQGANDEKDETDQYIASHAVSVEKASTLRSTNNQ